MKNLKKHLLSETPNTVWGKRGFSFNWSVISIRIILNSVIDQMHIVSMLFTYNALEKTVFLSPVNLFNYYITH